MSVSEVKPGDLITASDWNLLVRVVNELTSQVSALNTTINTLQAQIAALQKQVKELTPPTKLGAVIGKLDVNPSERLDLKNRVLTLKSGDLATIDYTVKFTEPGVYQPVFDPPLSLRSPDWQIAAGAAVPIEITQEDLDRNNGVVSVDAAFSVTALNSSKSGAQQTVGYRRASDHAGALDTFTLKLDAGG
jgi:hypothetical protein